MFYMICLGERHAVSQLGYCVIQSGLLWLWLLCGYLFARNGGEKYRMVVSCTAPVTLLENWHDIGETPLAWYCRCVQAGLKDLHERLSAQ